MLGALASLPGGVGSTEVSGLLLPREMPRGSFTCYDAVADDTCLQVGTGCMRGDGICHQVGVRTCLQVGTDCMRGDDICHQVGARTCLQVGTHTCLQVGTGTCLHE